jgi:hypothetical protein
LWRWCPQPERLKLTRTRPTDRALLSLAASALILSLLAIQGMQMLTPSAVNVSYPSSYSAFPSVVPKLETPTQTTPASEITSSVSSEHLTVKFTFPESADPGNSVTISATTTAKANTKVDSLSIEVFTYVDQQLVKAAAATVLTNQRVREGDNWQTTLVVSIPSNAQRSSMIGTVTEVWEEMANYYSPYYSPYDAYYAYYPYYPPYPYDYTVFYVYEPSYIITEKSSQQTVPLTYVLATTPEYEALLAKHQRLQRDYDALSARYNELSSKYDSLRSDYNLTVSKYTQLQSDHNATTLELGTYKVLTYALIVVAVALGAALGFFLFQRRRVTHTPKKSQA